MELVWKILDTDGAPVTGGAASTTVTIRRGADGYLYDFDDDTFKASGWTTVADTWAEADATNLPGVYTKTVTITDFDNGFYQIYSSYTDSVPVLYGSQEVYIFGGKEVPESLHDEIYDLTHDADGDPIVRIIPPPDATDICRVYEFCYNQSGADSYTVTACAVIVDLPYDYNDKLHVGVSVDASTGVTDGGETFIYWDIVYGATVRFKIDEHGVNKVSVVPSTDTARVYDLTAI